MMIIGIDPGSTTGVYVLHVAEISGAGSTGLTGYGAQLPPADVVSWIKKRFSWADVANTPKVIIAMERFVVGPRAAKSGHRKGQSDALDVIGAVRQRFAGRLPMRELPAGTAKTWGTDHRLRASGLLDGLEGQRHARDALRHALYAAVAGGYARDPLSKK